MKTRRSWKHQEKLWRELGNENIVRCRDCKSYYPVTKNKGECMITGRMILGNNVANDRECFIKREVQP